MNAFCYPISFVPWRYSETDSLSSFCNSSPPYRRRRLLAKFMLKSQVISLERNRAKIRSESTRAQSRLKFKLMNLQNIEAEIDFFDNKFFKFTRISENGTRIFDLHLKYTQKYLDNGLMVLDIGCNDGRHTLFLRDKGYKAFGLDLSRKAIKRSQDKFFAFGEHLQGEGMKHFICANAYNIPIKTEKFDVVLLLETLHHISEKEKVLKNIKEILKPRGKIIISEPNPDNILRPLGKYFGKKFSFISPNETLTPTDETLKAISKHFEIKKFFFYLTPIPILLVFIYEILINLTGTRSKLMENILSILYRLENITTENNTIGRRAMWRLMIIGEKTDR